MPILSEAYNPYDFVWYGHLSYCDPGGPILTFIRKVIAESEIGVHLVIPPIDGIVDAVQEKSSHTLITLEDLRRDPCLIGTISTRNVQDPRIVLLPLDDESFMTGVETALAQRMVPPSWESRQPLLFWRGQCSGGGFPTLRYKVVELLHKHPLADVRLIRDPNFPASRMGSMDMSDDSLFSGRCSLQDHMKFKYTIIVDGACIASSHQWMFASGCVPLMVSHPDNDYWFKAFLKPNVHYVPIKYDLSDIEDKLEWLVANDDAAKEIARHAMEFARTILSAEFQQSYLRKEIHRVLKTL